MKKHSFFLLIVWACLILTGCKSEKNTDKLSAYICHKADSLYKAEKIPGIFIGVLNNGQKSYYAAGYADPDKKLAFDSASLFEIGSISKTFTAYVLESVLKENNISDSSSIFQYLPDSVQHNKALADITFLSLLNHTSGLPRLPENMDLSANPMSPYDNYTLDDLYSYLLTCQPQPDGKSHYSNLGMGLAGVLAQRIAGKTYESLLHEYIFKPAGINQHPDSTILATTNKAQGYFEKNKSVYWFADALAPAGGLKCSAEEILAYLQFISSAGDNKTKPVIDKILEPTVTLSPAMKICRAWHTREEKDQPVMYWHNGGTYGFSTFAGFIKNENKAVIVVINQFNKSGICDPLGFLILQKLMQK